MISLLITLLTTGVFSDESPVYAELLNGEFRPESLTSAVPTPGYNLFGTSKKIVDNMREALWLDFDPRVNPEDEGHELNYPGSLESFDPKLVRYAALDVIQQRNEEYA